MTKGRGAWWGSAFPPEVRTLPRLPECVSVSCCIPLEELLSLLGSGLVGVGEEELEEALGRARAGGGGGGGGEGAEAGSGRESRVALYEFSDPLVCMCVCVSCHGAHILQQTGLLSMSIFCICVYQPHTWCVC